MSKAVNWNLKLLTFLLFKTKTDSILDLYRNKAYFKHLSIFIYSSERTIFLYDVEISSLICIVIFEKEWIIPKVAASKKKITAFSQNLLYWFKICQLVFSQFYRNSHFHIEIQSSEKICCKHGFDFYFSSSIFKTCKYEDCDFQELTIH